MIHAPHYPKIRFPPWPWAALIIASVFAGPAAGQSAEPLRPRIVAQSETGPVVAVVEIERTEDSAQDRSADIQKAIDRVADAGGGVIFLRFGIFRLEKPILIREGVTLRGGGKDQLPIHPIESAILAIAHGRGEADGAPAITMERGSGVRNLAVWHPEQSPDQITPYPWTFRFSEEKNGDNMTVENVMMINPYQGIKVGPEWNELHTIRNVSGTPLKTGIWNDTCTDIGRIVNVMFAAGVWAKSNLPNSPVTSAQREALERWLIENAEGIVIGRSDWEFIDSVKVIGYRHGLRFIKGQRGETNAVVLDSLFDCDTALVIGALNRIGLACSRSRLWGRSSGVEAQESFNTIAQFFLCDIQAENGPAVWNRGSGVISLNRCALADYEDAAIRADGGKLLVRYLDTPLEVTTPVARLGKTFEHAALTLDPDLPASRLVNESEGASVTIRRERTVKAQTIRSARPGYPFAPLRTTRLIDVSAYGADPESDDNTAAFVRAMDAAEKSGGAVVYVPPGLYRVKGSFTLPPNTELRGCFDVPHHTISGGSTLAPIGQKGKEDGEPFIRMKDNSGIRGVTFWWPEQNPNDPSPYPWAISVEGEKCWIVNTTMGNAWRGVIAAGEDCRDPYIEYLAGAFYNRGIWVDQPGTAIIRDIQFNPHYALRLRKDFPHPPFGERIGEKTIRLLRRDLEGIVVKRGLTFGRRTFLYAAKEGLSLRADDGQGGRGYFVIHGSDTCGRSVYLARDKSDRDVFLNAQLVPKSEFTEAAVVTAEPYEGDAVFYNTQVWGSGSQTALLKGAGNVTLDQMNSLSGPIDLVGGSLKLHNAHFLKKDEYHLKIWESAKRVEHSGNICAKGPFHVVEARKGEGANE